MINNLKMCRKNRNESQKDIANLLGISQGTYSRWENSEVEIPSNKLIMLASHWGVDPREIMVLEPSDFEEILNRQWTGFIKPEDME